MLLSNFADILPIIIKSITKLEINIIFNDFVHFISFKNSVKCEGINNINKAGSLAAMARLILNAMNKAFDNCAPPYINF